MLIFSNKLVAVLFNQTPSVMLVMLIFHKLIFTAELMLIPMLKLRMLQFWMVMFDKLNVAVFVMLNAITPCGFEETLYPTQSNRILDWLKSKHVLPLLLMLLI